MHKYFDPSNSYSANLQMWNGKPNSAAMINNICSFAPRTRYIIDVLVRIFNTEGERKVLILSERRAQHTNIEKIILSEKIGTGVGYYVGGMNQKALDESAEKQIILATYQMAAEGMNIPALNTVIFASPIADIQQSIGRILREKPSERKYIPLCIDIWDEFSIFVRKGYTRIKYYKANDYVIKNFVEDAPIEDKKDVKYTFIDEE